MTTSFCGIKGVPSSHVSKLVTAILVTYRSRDVIQESIESLLTRQGVDSVIMVDNTNDHAICETVRKQFPTVKVISNTHNGGFGQANNIGLSLVETPFALVLNPDAKLPFDGVAKLLDIAIAEPQVAVVGPWHCHDQVPYRSMAAGSLSQPEKIRFKPNTTFNTNIVLGAAMLLRMDALREVGFFDPEIFLYFEEDELCERLRRANYELRVTSDVLMHHRVGQSSTPAPGINEMKEQHFAWSRLYVEQKLHGRLQAERLAKQLMRTYRIWKWTAPIKGRKDKQFWSVHRPLGVECFLEGKRPPTDPTQCVLNVQDCGHRAA